MAPLRRRRRRQRDYSCMQPLKDRALAAGLGPAGASGSVPYHWLPYPDEVEVEEGAEEGEEEETKGAPSCQLRQRGREGESGKRIWEGINGGLSAVRFLIERVTIFRLLMILL